MIKQVKEFINQNLEIEVEINEAQTKQYEKQQAKKGNPQYQLKQVIEKYLQMRLSGNGTK